PGILDGELRPIERSVLVVELRRGIVLLLRLVEPAEVDAEGGEGIAVLRVLPVQLDRLLVQAHDLIGLYLRDAEGGLRLAEQREGTGRVRLRRLVEVLVRGVVVELAEGLFAGG